MRRQFKTATGIVFGPREEIKQPLVFTTVWGPKFNPLETKFCIHHSETKGLPNGCPTCKSNDYWVAVNAMGMLLGCWCDSCEERKVSK